MKLLIITQKVDENDDVLGFFHRWIEEFAKHCEQVTVICLYEGEYHLPKNVKVLSLGKEEGVSRLTYLSRFYKYIWHEHKNYNNVFVHMNQEYVLLGWSLWKLWNKKIFLWRNHAKGDWMTHLAVLFSDKVFCTSPQSFTARFKKTKIMPVGVDIDFFKPDSSVQKKFNSILFLGRIAPVKNVDIFVEVLKELKDKGVEFFATIAGGSSSKDIDYEKMIRDKVLLCGLGDRVTFTGAVPQKDTLKLYREHELYVNLTPSGSLDKTIFEAIASGLKILTLNTFFVGKLPKSWIATNPQDLESLVLKIKNNLIDSHNYNSDSQEKILIFLERHNLENLMKELMVIVANSLK